MMFGSGVLLNWLVEQTWRTLLKKVSIDGFRLESLDIGETIFFGHWYERILVPMMMIVWLYLLWFLESPFYLIGIIATWLWMLYVFNILMLKEEYYDYRKS
ncbi:MAG: hypothetical protein QXR06_03725 [Candidatus Bathyarchaeia archaeon]